MLLRYSMENNRRPMRMDYYYLRCVMNKNKVIKVISASTRDGWFSHTKWGGFIWINGKMECQPIGVGINSNRVSVILPKRC